MPLPCLASRACSAVFSFALHRQGTWEGERVNGFVSEQGSAASAVSVAGDTGRNEVGLKGTGWDLVSGISIRLNSVKQSSNTRMCRSLKPCGDVKRAFPS